MIYFDHNATTPLDDRVLASMQAFLGPYYGNASGLYRLGRLSRGAMDAAREQVAALVGATAAQVIFTSGGTEANNLALKGMALAMRPGLIVTGATEHPSITGPLGFLVRHGWTVETLPAATDGRPIMAHLDEVDGRAVGIGTLMLANNETGVLHDTAAFAMKIRALGGRCHIDAVQAAGKVPVDFDACGADSMTISSHKIYGPKGVGALIVDRAIPIEPLLHGGGQEQGLRGGTENVAGIVGFGKAAELARVELDSRRQHNLNLRQRLEARLAAIPGLTVFAANAERLPNTVQFSLPGYEGETLVMTLDRQGFALSSGSACASGGGEPSPVLTAMGINDDTARGAVRVSLGRGNTVDEVDRFADTLLTLIH
ncbi:MAG: cysteine desulfurase family protein [Methylococcaceae bacterium]|jgi:cysteine desulfurase